MGKRMKSILINLELIFVSLIVLVPVFWIVISSFHKGNGLASSTLIPKVLSLDNYRRLFEETSYITWFKNSLSIALLNSFLSVMLIMVTAWVVSRFHFKGKKNGLMIMLILSMFPSFLSMTAIYTLFMTFGLNKTPLALVIIYSTGAIPYNVWLVKGYLDGISTSLDEAAYIDGSTKFYTFVKIILPLSKPIIVYCAVSQFMMPWMDYILPNLLFSGESTKTVAVGLYSMITGNENSNFTLFAAGAVLIAIPITILYLIFQSYLVEGISSGANKG
ncbi:carbohydrate ABC transporter membrane protein 2 (CUT1 family) [Mobilisporobacter senegalensis]|uniref:Carbohydrate ABC transporter membrane protein 2 (CUT1 family) n=1 Tax=Mobilisporobacter senegalensis TaxID=1329262 RepID=A0A3N1X9G4_9FIRM|nr:sugar ABC transporter permease [Mobilisporobacter senegalensis]ROR23420.1 carbohydrate ABC transporter membrane protein 2 (CUT1 family) [Mobilisporobacter senegalensis]